MSPRIAAFAFASLIAAPSALACTCASGPVLTVPNGVDDVSTSASIFVEYSDHWSASQTDLVLVDAATGKRVAHTVEDWTQGSLPMRKLTPELALDSSATYAVYEDWGDEVEPLYIAEFTTGIDEDSLAPGGIEIVEAQTQEYPPAAFSCGGGVYVDLDIASPEDGVLYEIEVTRAGGEPRVLTFLNERAMLGSFACGQNLPALGANETVQLRSRAVDLSGNEGPWSEITENTTAQAGCSSVGDAGMASGWLTLLAILGLRRKHIATLAIASLAAAPSAIACSCAYGPTQAIPNGVDGVSTSASVYVEYNYLDSASDIDLLLVNADTGEAVPHTVEDSPQGDVLIRKLTPEAPLESNANYEVYEDWGDEDSDPWTLAEFTTGADADSAAPERTEILKARSHRDRAPSAACGGGVRLEIEVTAPEDGVLYEIEVIRESGEEQVFTFLTDEWMMLGHGGCTNNVDDLTAGENLSLRSRAIDVSGNAGPWSEFAESRRAGCSSVGDAGLASGWLTLLALLGLRRKRI